MKNLENYSVSNLESQELKKTNGGGYWGPFWGGYILSEIINGVQDGLTRDCPC